MGSAVAKGSVARGWEEVGWTRAPAVCGSGDRTRREPPLQPPEKQPVAGWRAGVARKCRCRSKLESPNPGNIRTGTRSEGRPSAGEL